MRTIKFKAWNPESEIMMETRTIQELVQINISKYFAEKLIFLESTSFLDEVKVEIFEGDLFDGFGEGIKYFEVRFEKGEVVLYNNYGKWGTLDRFFQIASDYKIAVIVRGNIYENPELLS